MNHAAGRPLLAATIRGINVRISLDGRIPSVGLEALRAHFADWPPRGAERCVQLQITGDGPWAVRHGSLCCLTADTWRSLLVTVEHVLHRALLEAGAEHQGSSAA